MRTCSECGADISSLHRLSRYCGRSCKDRANYAKHAEARRAQQAEYRAANKVARSAYDQARREADPEANRERLRDYYQRNKLAFMQARDRRRSAAQIPYSEADWQRILLHYRGCCAYCGSSERIEREHVVPLAKGGEDRIGNVVPACYDCNRSKNKKYLAEWKLHRKKLAALAA